MGSKKKKRKQKCNFIIFVGVFERTKERKKNIFFMILKIVDRGQVNSSRTRRRRPEKRAGHLYRRVRSLTRVFFVSFWFFFLWGGGEGGRAWREGFFVFFLFTSFSFLLSSRRRSVSTAESFVEKDGGL